MSIVQRTLRQHAGNLLRSVHSTSNSPPNSSPALLLKIRTDMKEAMKAKDSNRLDVLRGCIAEVTNAAKNSKPVTTDWQMVSIIRKRIKSSEAAVVDAQTAKRDDLVTRESAQLAMLRDYIQDSKSLGEEEITIAAQDVIGKLRTEGKKVNQGKVMKALVGSGGVLEGQTVDKAEIARLVGPMV